MVSFVVETVIRMTKKIPGECFVFLAALLWSLSGVLIRGTNCSASWSLGIRGASAAFCLLPFVKRTGWKFSRWHLLAGFFYTLFCLSFILLVRVSTVAIAISMLYTAPLYVLLYNMVKKRKVGWKEALPFVLLLAGLFLNTLSSWGVASIQVLVFSVLCGLGYLLYGLFLKRTDDTYGGVAKINIVSLVLCSGLLFFDFTPVPTGSDVLILLFFGVVISALSYVFFRVGLTKISLERALIISLAEIVLNPAWVFFFRGETVPPLNVLAVIVILAGALLNIMFSQKEA